MTTLAEKGWMGLLGHLHAVMDEFIDFNSVPVMKQYVRRYEQGIKDIEELIAKMIGAQTSADRRIDRLTAAIEERDRNITLILTDGNPANDVLTTAMQVTLDADTLRLQTLQQQFNTDQEALDALQKTRTAMVTKKGSLLSQIDHLEMQSQMAETRRRSADLIERAVKISGSIGGEFSVDNIADNIERENDMAQARLNSAMTRLNESGTSDDEATEIARMKIEDRKRRLSGGQQEGGEESPTRLQQQ